MTPKELDGAATRLVEEARQALEEIVLRTEGPNAFIDEQRDIVERALLTTLERERGLVEALRGYYAEHEEDRRDDGDDTWCPCEYCEQTRAALHAVEEPGGQSG